MRTTLELPDLLFRTLKARAALDGTTLKELMLRFVQRGLSETEAQPLNDAANTANTADKASGATAIQPGQQS